MPLRARAYGRRALSVQCARNILKKGGEFPAAVAMGLPRDGEGGLTVAKRCGSTQTIGPGKRHPQGEAAERPLGHWSVKN